MCCDAVPEGHRMITYYSGTSMAVSIRIRTSESSQSRKDGLSESSSQTRASMVSDTGRWPLKLAGCVEQAQG